MDMYGLANYVLLKNETRLIRKTSFHHINTVKGAKKEYMAMHVLAYHCLNFPVHLSRIVQGEVKDIKTYTYYCNKASWIGNADNSCGWNELRLIRILNCEYSC